MIDTHALSARSDVKLSASPKRRNEKIEAIRNKTPEIRTDSNAHNCHGTLCGICGLGLFSPRAGQFSNTKSIASPGSINREEIKEKCKQMFSSKNPIKDTLSSPKESLGQSKKNINLFPLQLKRK